MLKVSKRPASVCIEELCMRSAKEASYKYGVDFNRLCRIAAKGEGAFAEFEKALEQELENNFERIIRVLKKQGASTGTALGNNLRNISELFASIYTFKNCRRFIYDSNEEDIIGFMTKGVPSTISQYNFMDVFDDIDDMIIDIKFQGGYSSFMIRLCRASYKIDNKRGTDLDSFNVTYLLNKDSRSIILNQFVVAKGIFPHLLIDYKSTGMQCASGNRCPRSVLMENTYKNPGYSETRELCFMTEKKMNEHACFMSALRPYDVLSIAAYVWDTYKNRHTLERKNSKRREHYKNHEVSMIAPEDRVIRSLHTQYKYEREHRPWQGGHHQSPIEHERRSHERVYRNEDGSIKKVVQVKGSVINKGGKKGFYKVDEPTDEMDLF